MQPRLARFCGGKLSFALRLWLGRVIMDAAEEPSEINFVEFRRIVCMSQDMLQGKRVSHPP